MEILQGGDPNGSAGGALLTTIPEGGPSAQAGLVNGDLVTKVNGKTINMSAELPEGSCDARPFEDGVLFNDTEANVVRFAGRDHTRDRAFNVPATEQQSFGRGLCVVNDQLVAAGSSPATVALHDLESGETALSVRLSNDDDHSIHGLEVWPFS